MSSEDSSDAYIWSRSALAASSAWLPLLYDTTVVLLTVNLTARSIYSSSRNPSQMFRVLLQEGLIYYLYVMRTFLPFTICEHNALCLA